MKHYITLMLLAVAPFFSKAQNIMAIEYAIDTDAGIGNNTIVNVHVPAADDTFSFNPSFAGVSPGYHTLYFRTRNSNGEWSHTSWRTVEVIADHTPANVLTGEVFWDTDPGFGQGYPFTFSPQNPDVNFVYNLPVAQVQTGQKTLFVRVKDRDDKWSHTVWTVKTITIGPDPTSVNEIAGAAYTLYPNPTNGMLNINLDLTPKTPVEITITDITGKILNQQQLTNKTASIDLSSYVAGTYMLRLQSEKETKTEKIVVHN